GAVYSALTLRECRIAGAAFTGSCLVRATIVDCVITEAELSGAVLEDCRFERVEFQRCRMSGVQAQGSRFRDVALLDCKVDDGNFRMTDWEWGEMRDSNLVDSDFYGSRLPASRIHGCDLSNVEFSKCDLAGSHLQRSRLDGIRGGDSLRGVTIGSDQVIPAALALFGAVGISIDDE
ncbi:MAG: pentapeptide repeat-containing protein, partial [Acidimicrobiaceae bacterium]|nr:pentapeptide repeat-containing protein [Acidimicrobiaceae bacterium]